MMLLLPGVQDSPKFVHFSFIHSFLTGAITKPEDLPEDDWRLKNPRFAGEAFKKVGSRDYGEGCGGDSF
jgi:hypothetical protein